MTNGKNCYIINLTLTIFKALMKGYLISFILGIVVATVGFSGIAKILDNGIATVKVKSQEYAK